MCNVSVSIYISLLFTQSPFHPFIPATLLCSPSSLSPSLFVYTYIHIQFSPIYTSILLPVIIHRHSTLSIPALKDSCEMVDQMAAEQYLQEASNLGDCSEIKRTSQEKFESGSNTENKVEQGITGSFDCNICLDFVHDPVVTLCGHLFCWPCIYKWIHYQSVSSENLDYQQPQCPVCKAVVSKENLVPLYGRGLSTKPSDSTPSNLGLVIPQRPSTTRCGSQTHTSTPTIRPTQQLHYHQHRHHVQPYYSFPDTYSPTPMLSLSSTTATNPVVGVFGEMVYARLFGNSETTLYNPNSYNIIINSNPRFRRHVMEADKSLGRLLFFLCCCMVLCLLLF